MRSAASQSIRKLYFVVKSPKNKIAWAHHPGLAKSETNQSHRIAGIFLCTKLPQLLAPLKLACHADFLFVLLFADLFISLTP